MTTPYLVRITSSYHGVRAEYASNSTPAGKDGILRPPDAMLGIVTPSRAEVWCLILLDLLAVAAQEAQDAARQYAHVEHLGAVPPKIDAKEYCGWALRA